ncbi:scavenger receptor cysteine-rich type 1 protein M130-like [Mizuhopecten yessoensis]|uniref:scavenger receptor cysteine-rich type 1 protein M130-like n=1 Tax=Mizuhopecten yessoensis TaxID=6573 RepID=UPI000B45C7C0|nr:scavenger receptor cysteine-rich type 1 protein M130-like [Mizuhopecten yessoensis]
MLGYSDGTAIRYAVFGEGSGTIWMSDVNCIGTESDIRNCYFSGWGAPCNHSQDAGVICFDNTGTSDFDVRLGESDRVEVYYNGQWGYIGGWSWDDDDANVICVMLNHNSGTALTIDHFHGKNNRIQPTWMDNVQCVGTETSILNCQFDGWGVIVSGYNDTYQNSAAVTCSDEPDLDSGATSPQLSPILAILILGYFVLFLCCPSAILV